jgi:hypothetical protein
LATNIGKGAVVQKGRYYWDLVKGLEGHTACPDLLELTRIGRIGKTKFRFI